MAGTNYTRQSTFADGDTITAALFNDEYNQLVNAFSYASTGTTGHQHDGSVGQGGNITTIGDQDFLNKIVVDSTNNRWGVYIEVGGSTVEQIRFQDGAIVPVTDDDIDLGTSLLEFKDLYLDGTANIDSLVADTADINAGTIDGTTIGVNSASTGAFTTLTASGATTLSGTLSVEGNTTLGNAATDTVTFTADIASNILPSADSTYDLGDGSNYWANAYIDSITTTGNVSVGGNLTVTGTTTLNGGTLTLGDAASDNVVFGADVNSSIIPNTDDLYDLGSSTQQWRNIYVDGTAYLDAINFNGTAITSTAAELNILDGVTATATELNLLDGVTATTAELNILAGKLFLDEDGMTSDSATGIPSQQSVKAYVDSQVQSADALAELTDTNVTTPADGALLFYDTTTSKWIDNVVSGDVTIADTGVAAISSGVIVNADINASAAISISKTALTDGTGLTLTGDTLSVDASQTQITAVGTIATGTWQGTAIADAYVANDLTISGGTVDNSVIGGTTAAAGSFTTLSASSTFTLGGTAVTSTAAELNILDGVTATASELNILDGVTATATELNILDGVTATAAEINIIDGTTIATATTLAGADRVVVNDAGVMKQVALTDFETYFDNTLNYQAQGDVLDDLNTLGAATADGEFIVATGAGAFAYESGATARTSLGVSIGSDVQAYGAVLDDLNTLGAATADGEFIVATGAGAFAYESGATARTSMDAQQNLDSYQPSTATLDGINDYFLIQDANDSNNLKRVVASEVGGGLSRGQVAGLILVM